MELTDGNVTLRTPTDDDAPAVAEAVRASLDRLAPWMPWATEGYDEAAALQWIRRELEPKAVNLVVVDGDGRIVGSTGLNQLDEHNRRANLGYWLRADATGRGLATAATRLVAAHGLNDLGLHRIEVIMSVENEPSRRVAERAGAVYEGVQRGRLLLHGRFHDVHCFVFLGEG